MAWKNLRSEISELFTELSSGEHLSEYVQGLLAKRHVLAKERAARAVAYARKWREQEHNRVKYREWNRISRRRATLRRWAEEEPRICRHCWQEYKRPAPGMRFVTYCSEKCSSSARQTNRARLMRAYHEAHKAEIKARRQRWYQQNREKILAKQASDERKKAYQEWYRKTQKKRRAKYRKQAERKVRQAARKEAQRAKQRAKSLAYYHANKARISEQRKQRRAAQKGTQP